MLFVFFLSRLVVPLWLLILKQVFIQSVHKDFSSEITQHMGSFVVWSKHFNSLTPDLYDFLPSEKKRNWEQPSDDWKAWTIVCVPLLSMLTLKLCHHLAGSGHTVCFYRLVHSLLYLFIVFQYAYLSRTQEQFNPQIFTLYVIFILPSKSVMSTLPCGDRNLKIEKESKTKQTWWDKTR